MKIFNDEISKQLKDLLGDIPAKVNLLFFGSEKNCRSCMDTEKFLIEFADLHKQIQLESHDVVREKELADQFSIDKVPAIVILDSNQLGIMAYLKNSEAFYIEGNEITQGVYQPDHQWLIE